jgi:hypothetical protein
MTNRLSSNAHVVDHPLLIPTSNPKSSSLLLSPLSLLHPTSQALSKYLTDKANSSISNSQHNYKEYTPTNKETITTTCNN